MNGSPARRRSGTVARLIAAGALACTVPLLAACTSTDAAPSPSSTGDPSGSAVDGGGGERGADDVAARLASVDGAVEIEGYAVPAQILGRTPVGTVGDLYGDGADMVEPASCTAFHTASELATGQDVTVAAADEFNPIGPFFPGGELPEGEPESMLSANVRVFGDESLAAALTPSLLDAECTVYTVTSTWDEGEQVLENQVQDVTEVELDGVDAPTVRIAYSGGTSVINEGTGESVSSRGPWNSYVHVDGPYAISVMALGIDDEEQVVASVIRAVLDHMDAA